MLQLEQLYGSIFAYSIGSMYRKGPTNLLTRFLNIGITPELSFKETQKTFLFNLFVLFAIPTVPVFFVINLLKGEYGLVLLNSIQLLLYYGCLYVAITRKGLSLRTTFIWLSSIIFFIGGYRYENGNEYLMFTNLIAALIIFEYKGAYFTYAAISLSGFGFIKISQFHYPSIEAALSARSTINMFIAFCIIAIVLQYFKTMHYAYQEKLETAFDDLMDAKKEKDRILKIVAHDLRSPISGISALSEMLMKDESDPTKIECLKMMHDASKQSIEFIGEVMQMESSADIQIELKEIDLHQLIDKVVQMQMHELLRKQLNISLLLKDCPRKVQIDPEKIERVISNLLHNAIKFSNKDGHIEISAQVFQTHQMLISVKDTGIGIPEKYHENLFTKVGSSKRNGTDGEKSYGIGLVICKQIIEAHKGQISVLSQVGKGSTFNILLPIETAA